MTIYTESSANNSTTSFESGLLEKAILEYVLWREGSSLLLELCGELDMYSCGPLQPEVREALLDPACTDLIVDARALTFMDSSGINMLVKAMQIAQRRQGHVYMTGCGPEIRYILSVVRLDRIFRLCDSLSTAHELLSTRDEQTQPLKEAFVCNRPSKRLP